VKFRKDINGLRAIAVIAVVLFHFNPNLMPGGFAGVDVFFVISGYLMTSIIFRGLEQKNFSILKFYIARANRIIPALAVLCLTLLVFGWFFLIPTDYKVLAKHTATSTSFLSNIIYWTESGYFDSSSHEKWLLHTWSLSVEWQFYIIYPAALVLLSRVLSVTALKNCIIHLTLVGFIFCIYATFTWPNMSYYLFPTRAWEMMFGGLAYLFSLNNMSEKQKRNIGVIGNCLIITSCVFITQDVPWPGYMAIVPVLGAFLVIQAQNSNSFISQNIFIQKIGSWSYSIYLWHWPIVVGLAYFSIYNIYTVLAGITLTILFGYLSYKYIERINFKTTFHKPIDLVKSKPLHIVFFTCILSSTIYITNGISGHYNENVLIADRESSNKNPFKCMVENKFPCYIGNKENVKAIIIGDSHADALTTSLASVFNLNKEGIIALTKSACPYIINALSTKSGNECFIENQKREEFLLNNYENIPVVWAARTGVYIYGQSNKKRINNKLDTQPSIFFKEKYNIPNEDFFIELEENLNETISKLRKKHPIYIVQPTPEMRRNIPKAIAKNYLLKNESTEFAIDESLYLQRNTKIRNLLKKIAYTNDSVILDPAKILCSDNKCIAEIQNRPIYFDGDHLSEFGNKLLTPMFLTIVKESK
tara:strand:- start:627 stop:2564 length:1938 start_codon:yes stop_codon:yes gene_type:complete